MFHSLSKRHKFYDNEALKNVMVVLFVVSTIFACESKDISPINPSAPPLSTGVHDSADEEFEIYMDEFDRDLSKIGPK